MLTNLLNRMLISELNQLELVPAGPSIGRNFDAYSYCSDGSCSGIVSEDVMVRQGVAMERLVVMAVVAEIVLLVAMALLLVDSNIYLE